jgi:hypothetical protein
LLVNADGTPMLYKDGDDKWQTTTA